MPVTGKVNVTPLEEKTVDEEPLVYANKQVWPINFSYAFVEIIVWVVDYNFKFYFFQEAKNAFKALLESANVESDWTWEQVIKI